MIIHLLLTLGVISFITGLLIPSTIMMSVTPFLLGGGLGFFALIIIAVVFPAVNNDNNAVRSIRLAIIALLVTIVIGISLIVILIPQDIRLNTVLFTELHMTWGILGWIALLVIGMAFQLVPMLQMTGKYPRWMNRYLLPALFTGLVMWTITRAFDPGNQWLPDILLLLCITGYAGFAIVTLWLQQNRSRKTPDSSVRFWRIAMLSVLAGAIVWLANSLMPGTIKSGHYPFILGALLLTGFAVSVINGMLYKIMPFLIWFHLQNLQLSLGLGRKYAIPSMKQIIPDQSAYWHFNLHTTGVLSAVLASVYPADWLIYIAGLVMAASFSLLLHNQLKAVLLYWNYSKRLRNAGNASIQLS